MMHAHEKSDSAIVAGKPTNKAERSAMEPVEPRAETKGNANQQSMHRTQSRASVTQALERVRKAASKRKKERFTALLHHISVEHLEAAFFELQKNVAAGVDGLTWRAYEADLKRSLEDLHGRLHRGAYRPLPTRRVFIPKPDGQQRPLAVAALEDKIVQRATTAVLNAIYEEDFLGFLRGHYAYYGVAGNLRCLVKVYRAVERYWHRMLRSRSWAGRRLTWEKYHQIKARTPLLKPKLRLPYAELQALAVL